MYHFRMLLLPHYSADRKLQPLAFFLIRVELLCFISISDQQFWSNYSNDLRPSPISYWDSNRIYVTLQQIFHLVTNQKVAVVKQLQKTIFGNICIHFSFFFFFLMWLIIWFKFLKIFNTITYYLELTWVLFHNTIYG